MTLPTFLLILTGVLLNAGAQLLLKAGVNPVAPRTLVVTEAYAELDVFRNHHKIVLDRNEEYAANSLWINDRVLMPAGFPRTRERFLAAGLSVLELDVSEVQKMDGGLTCMSLRF